MSSPSADEAQAAPPIPGLDGSVKSYVLRAGRETPAQKRAYDETSERFVVPFRQTALDFAGLFGNDNPVVMEIGFGMGEATAEIAAKNPDRNYLGVEVYKPGVGRLLWNISQRAIPNVKIVRHDAVEVVVKMIPPGSLAGAHLFFPDPWPKKRHHKRRLVKRPFTEILASKLKPAGYLYMVTDWEDYADWALVELTATPGLVNTADGFAPPRDWRPLTGFERKGLEKKHAVRELYFEAAPR